MSNDSSSFFKPVNSWFKFRLFLLLKLPSAFFCGVRVQHADENKCIVTVPFKWFNQNPFKSTYFACLSMAGEMSTGVLGMAHIYKRNPSVSMLVVNINGSFFKKAIGKTTFICTDGILIRQAIESSIASGEGKTVICKSIGTNVSGEVVAEFLVTWSFKAKQK
jgi:exopolysaccharide biosynthesis protein